MLVAARAMQAGLDILEPLLEAAGHEPIAKVAIVIIKGHVKSSGVPVYFDYSKAGFFISPTPPPMKYKLAGIVHGGSEESLNAQAVYASISGYH